MLCINNLVTDSPRTTPLLVVTTYNYKPLAMATKQFFPFDFDIASRFYAVDGAFVRQFPFRPFLFSFQGVFTFPRRNMRINQN